MAELHKKINIKNGSVNDRPLFMQNGNRRFSSYDDVEIGNFRRALPQFIAVSVKNILLFVYGMTLGFPTIVIPAIQGGNGQTTSDIVLNRDEISWFSSINLICVPLGCVFSGMLSQPIGKRRAMQFVNLPMLASWLLFHFSTKTEHLYAALCLSGLGGGLMEAPVLTYVAEITEPKYRGILSALGSACIITGIFVQFIMGSLMHWRTIAAVSSAFPIVAIIALCFIPESPTWLIRENRFKEAVKSLQWLRGWVPEHEVEEEFNRLYDDHITKPAIELAQENENGIKHSKFYHTMKMFKKRSFLVPFLLVAYTFFVGHFSGKTPLQTYAVQIFHTLKAPIDKYHATILLGVSELVATVMCVCLIHFTGKRPLVLVSTVGTGLCFFGTATYAHYLKVVPGFAVDNVVANASAVLPKDHFISQENITNVYQADKYALTNNKDNDIDIIDLRTTTFNAIPELLESNDSTENSFLTTTNIPTTHATLPETVHELLLPKQDNNDLLWLPLILLLCSAFFAHLGIRMIPWILIGEVFPAAVRSTASGMISGVGYIFGFLANKLFLQMLSVLTMPGTFWFYSAVALTGAFVLYFVLPETEDRTLSDIEAHFSKKSDTNLLRQTKSKLPIISKTSIPLDNLPNGLQTEVKPMQLRQSDLLASQANKQKNNEGITNLAYTTHF